MTCRLKVSIGGSMMNVPLSELARVRLDQSGARPLGCVRNCKNFNRMHTHLARLEAERANADDVVLLDDRGLLTESRGANVFLVRGSALYTPRGGILEGITRETVFEIAAELAIPA